MNLIPKEHALRLLEAQRVTGGIIDPNKNYRIDTLKKAVFVGLISQKIADELEKDSSTFKGNGHFCQNILIGRFGWTLPVVIFDQ